MFDIYEPLKNILFMVYFILLKIRHIFQYSFLVSPSFFWRKHDLSLAERVFE